MHVQMKPARWLWRWLWLSNRFTACISRAVNDWLTCNIERGFVPGFIPHIMEMTMSHMYWKWKQQWLSVARIESSGFMYCRDIADWKGCLIHRLRMLNDSIYLRTTSYLYECIQHSYSRYSCSDRRLRSMMIPIHWNIHKSRDYIFCHRRDPYNILSTFPERNILEQLFLPYRRIPSTRIVPIISQFLNLTVFQLKVKDLWVFYDSLRSDWFW